MSVLLADNGSATVLPSVVAGRGGIVQFTVDDVLSMIRQGVIHEDASTELLNGIIVHTDRSEFGGDPNMHSPGHRKAVRRLTSLVAAIDNAERHVQIQSPIVCGRRQMPELDFAVIRGSDDLYTHRLPVAVDVLCLIEVADSSLERDRTEKLPVYASSGIVQYIILNLRNRTAEVYTRPDVAGGTYAAPEIVDAEGTLALRIGESETLVVRLADVLP